MPELFMERYSGIKTNTLPARNTILRHLDVSFETDLREEELWNIHGRKMQRYRDLEQKIFRKGEPINLPEAEKNLLDLKIELAEKIISYCHLCQHRCMVDRHAGEKGFCRLTDVSRYAAQFMHTGEESQLVPSHTIFFTGCVFSCVFCQNWDISTHPESGRQVIPRELAYVIDNVRAQGSENVNFVTPTPHLVNVLKIVRNIEVNIPVIWNANMYHSPESAKLLEGVVDLYLGDFKYGNDRCAFRYSKIRNYMDTVGQNFKVAAGQAEVLVRHLVMPGHLDCCTRPVIKWIAENTPQVRLNLMFQYRPEYIACKYPEINRHLTNEEIKKALLIVKEEGLESILV